MARKLRIALSGQFLATIWPLATDDGVVQFLPKGSFSCDNVGMLFDMAREGHGIVRLADFVVAQAVKDGRLIEILAEVNRASPISLWCSCQRADFSAQEFRPQIAVMLSAMSSTTVV